MNRKMNDSAVNKENSGINQNITNNNMNKNNNTRNNAQNIAPEQKRMDLVFPHNNEKHLVDMALRFNITHLIMCYSLDDPMIKLRQKETQTFVQENLTTEFAIIVSNQQDVTRAKTMTSTIVGCARPEMFEDKRVSHIIDMESGRRDDFIHHKNSGLNQVFLQHAENTNKTLLVNANQLIFESRIARAVVLGRMMQNNVFYRKYNSKALVVSGAYEPMQMRSWRDMQILLDV